MISYEVIHDAVTAVLIILIVSVVVALAWLSTNVREQPLVAFVVFHSSNNGERDQSHQEQHSTRNRETQESSERPLSSSSVEVSSSSHREVAMEVKKITSEESIGNSHSKETVLAREGSLCDSKETRNTKLPQVERVDDISIKEKGNSSESGSVFLQSQSEMEDGMGTGLAQSQSNQDGGKSSQNTSNEDRSTRKENREASNEVRSTNRSQEADNEVSSTNKSQDVSNENMSTREANEVCPSSEPSCEQKGDPIPETELRKRRLQQFISMGDTTTTTHLERLSEQLTATLPSEISYKGSAEDKKSVCSEDTREAEGENIKSICGLGAKVPESMYSVGEKVAESVCSEGTKVKEYLTSGGGKVEPSTSEDVKVAECKDSQGAKVEEVSSCEYLGRDEVPPSLNLLGEAASAKETEEERPPGSIKIRLKFLDETQRHVFAHLTEQVGSFKRQHFSIEMDANRRIRLIFNGQLLSQDTSTLAQYGLFDNCVVHCHVSQPQQNNMANSREAAAQDEEDAYVSRLLAPLLYGVLAVMWYLRFEYGHLFNAMSTIILLFLTALLLVSTYLLYVTNHIPNPAAPTTATTTTTLPQPHGSLERKQTGSATARVICCWNVGRNGKLSKKGGPKN